ncbi:uncharacterized protein LOC116770913 [Danaus plexippus]|uniref:uncharacterized protein LOC116770913 n=1 Tax=Danaus plexippus TaxID=13037 RepID=UPI002AB2F154|nr:uncharacterized protein LOC116770913 [Danaus plexippus]
MWLWLLCAAAAVYSAEGAGPGAARLVCYVEGARASDVSECTHLVYAGDSRGEALDDLLKDYRKNNPRIKIILRVNEGDKDLTEVLKSKNVQGLEIYDAHKAFNKTKVLEMVESARAALTAAGGGPLFLALPSHPELLAKYYDLRVLVKKTDLMTVQTHALGLVKKMTYHPSRLSGLWDMMNTDSVVDLVIGLGVPASKVVISLPATARQFQLLNETLSTPGSPTTDDDPKEIDQLELCRQLRKGRWTLERDQDLSAPYAFKGKTWISFEDASSVDVKGKYARVRGLAGLALYNTEKDLDSPCAPTLRTALNKVLNQQSRAPRAAVLRSLENEILSAPHNARVLDALQVSPYRITQVVDADGVIHSIREDTRTEFSCSRQGYFVHPRSCARFYRCVKFDQLSPEYTVFEFDCPAGLAFDARYEVCVWPGSLPHAAACPGSSEIAPVPTTRFICPDHEGYYADPENCRWFFACLDHGKAPLTAYEFRCPFGLGFDAARLKCDWPWLVPACGNIARYEAEAFGYSGAALSGATGFEGKTADSVNIAAHQSLVSGASLNNLVGIQNGLLTNDDILDANYISSQEAANGGLAGAGTYDSFSNIGLSYQGEPSGVFYNYVSAEDINKGLVRGVNSEGEEKYTSGSIILDDYRLPSNKVNTYSVYNKGQSGVSGSARKPLRYNDGKYRPDNSGKYVHNPAGDRAKPYEHIGVPPVPYAHKDFKYKQSNENDASKYSGSVSGGYEYPRPKIEFHEGFGVNDNIHTVSGYNSVGVEGSVTNTYQGSYTNADVGKYVTDDRVYTGASHTLTAGAVNVGLVGKTTLLDADYANQGNYQGHSYNSEVVHHVSQPVVSVSHVSTADQNLDGYSYTTSTSSGVPTTVSPLSYTTYKTTYVPEVPKTSIKQVFGFTQPAVTYVQTAVVPVKQVTPQIQVTNYNQGVNYQYESKDYSSANAKSNENSEFTGYEYKQPSIKFENVPTATPAVTVVSQKPQNQQTFHTIESVGFEYSTPLPVSEQPFKKIVAYTTGPPVSTYVQSTSPAVSHQTIHKVETSKVQIPFVEVSGQDVASTGVNYEVPQGLIQYTTPQPSISVQPEISYQPQAFSQQTVHTVAANKVNSFTQGHSQVGYEYQGPSTISFNTNDENGYNYKQPNVRLEDAARVVHYSTPAPTVLYTPQSDSSQSIQRSRTQYVSSTARPFVSTTPVTLYENPLLQYTAKSTEITYDAPKYTSHSYSQQNHNRGVSSNSFASNGYSAALDQQTTVYSTPQPTLSVQSTITTYPQYQGQQTLHQVDTSRLNTYEGASINVDYSQPSFRVEQAKIETSTPASIASSTYKPQSYSQQTIHKYEKQVTPSTTPISTIHLSYQQPEVSVYENPILKYTQRVTPVTYVKPTASIFTQTYRPEVKVSHVTRPAQYETSDQQSYINQEAYTYNQPEIQRNIESSKSQTYSDASVVSSQYFHQGKGITQTNGNEQYESGKNVVFVSSTPATLAYEDHYTVYENQGKVNAYKAPEYIPPKEEIPQTYIVPTVSTPAVKQQGSILYSQDQYDYQPVGYSQQYQGQYTNSKASTSINNYEYTQNNYQSPEVQVEYKAEEYLPPVPSTARPAVSSTYRSRTYSTTTNAPEYLPPESETKFRADEYLPPVKNSYQSIVKSADNVEYLPPAESTAARVATFQRFGYNDEDESSKGYSTYQDYSLSTEAPIVAAGVTGRKQNIVVETAKSNLLGFGTVGPEAGLVSTTARPFISTTDNSYLPPKTATFTYTTETPEVTTTIRRTKPKYFRVPSSSTTPVYVESTTAYQAPEYLPPSEKIWQGLVETSAYSSTVAPKIRLNPYQGNTYDNSQIIVSTTTAPIRKQNVVVENAKAQLLGFGAVGSEAGLVTPASYSEIEPIEVSHDGTYSTVLPVQQQVEVTSARVPIRRVKPKVAIVTKINDFNPLLVKKLGAVCSCQSPVLILKGKRPNIQEEDVDYDNGYESGRGDLGSYKLKSQSARVTTVPLLNTVTTASPVVSTFNPIIVPDDSYYQDYQEASNDNVVVNAVGKDNSQSYVSSVPVVSTTERVVRIRPRVKLVTEAPTYKTVVLNKQVGPSIPQTAELIESAVNSPSFDRYGPGGWRDRDETLQGSIDCQRAGLFRHPKQCNKFYACRWDCTKQRFTLHVFNCPVQLSFDPNIGACNWPSQGPACQGDTLLTNAL